MLEDIDLSIYNQIPLDALYSSTAYWAIDDIFHHWYLHNQDSSAYEIALHEKDNPTNLVFTKKKYTYRQFVEIYKKIQFLNKISGANNE